MARLIARTAAKAGLIGRSMARLKACPDTGRGNSSISERVSAHQQVGGYKDKEDHGNHAVHGEEGGVQF